MGGARLAQLASIALLCAPAPAVQAVSADSLPPRAEWRATSTSAQVKEQAIGHLIDGNPKTRTGGSFSAGHWFQVDFGRPTTLAGARLTWDSANPQGYTLQTSLDGKAWSVAYEIDDSPGGIETAFFAPRRARYLRMQSLPVTADWGVSIFELEPIGGSQAARVTGLASGGAGAVWQAGDARAINGTAGKHGNRALVVELPHALATAGLLVDWEGAHGAAALEGRAADGSWSALAEDPLAAQSERSYLAARAPRTVDALRLTTSVAGDKLPAVRRLRLLGPAAVMTPMKRYQIAATRARSDLFPASLHLQQTYWTVVGVHAGRQKSIFDEYGNIEAFKGAPLVQPLWRDASGDSGGADGRVTAHRLREGWMPMPAVAWSPRRDLEITSEAFAAEQGAQPVTLVRHRLSNTGQRPIQGTLSLLVRPMQMNPPWQNGGLSPIDGIAIDGAAMQTRVRVNGRTLLQSLTPVDVRGAAPFGAHGETEITTFIADGRVPAALRASDADGLAAATLGYRVALAPGAHRDIVVAFPLGDASADAKGRLPEPAAIDRAALVGPGTDAGAGFDALAGQVADGWRKRFETFGISLPDASLVDAMRAQAAYMLINQTGPAMQPGPRNYNRSFIRDGAATAAVLLRMGQSDVARDYLRWYSDHAVHANGLVSPILNDDGSVNTGFGSDIEYDSQGEYIGLVADVARLDGGPGSVRDYLPKVIAAMRFLQALRERTLVPGYMADQPAPERFRGIIAPSISHEGYSAPTHSYWDNFWALKGWHDGAWLAESLGDAGTAQWAREQEQLLRTSLAASIRATMKWKGEDRLPADADLGSADPTSVSIALDPTGAQDVLPVDALALTYARYIDEVRARERPGALYAYTPYELRNVLTYVHLDQPAQADELLQTIARKRRPLEWHVFAEVIHSRLRFPRYLGDMPHTWIGAEYVRAVYGMLMHEGDERLSLLPGVPPSWLQGPGLRTGKMATAYGSLDMHARREGDTMTVTLGEGLRPNTKLRLFWPDRQRPRRVVVDGKPFTAYDASGVLLDVPFRTLQAQW